MKRLLAILLALTSVGLCVVAAPDAGAARRGYCENYFPALDIRQLPRDLAHYATGEGGCSFADAKTNSRGEWSVGPVQLNFAGANRAQYARWGITEEWALESEDNYWDTVVVLYNHCGLWPWNPVRVNGKRKYLCRPPAQRAYTLPEVYLMAMAEAALREAEADAEILVAQGFLPNQPMAMAA